MKKIILSIEGMTCSSCSNGLEKFLNSKEGINKASVNLVMATASIEYDEKILKKEDLDNLVKKAGFKSLGEAKIMESRAKSHVYPFFIFGFLGLLLMYISMSHMGLWLPKILHNPKVYSITLFILTIPFIFYGMDILKSGIKNLIHKMPNMDTLVTLGVFSSFFYSTFGMIMILKGQESFIHNLYFESSAFVIYFIKIGRFIDKKAHNKTKDAIKDLVMVTPKMAKLKTEDGFKEVTIDTIKKGDTLICFPGDKVAVDGKIVKGKAHFDESFITGESKPALKEAKAKVIAGAVNYDGTIEYVATDIGKKSMISGIIDLVVEASNTKMPISHLADKISCYFVPGVIILAFLTLIFSFIYGLPFNECLTRFVTVLVVACPCSLGLATPLAVVIASGACAKNGILIKNSGTLEIISKASTIVFDKTGTLTMGNLLVTKFYNYSKYNDENLLSILGSIENSSAHPIAQSILKYLDKKKITYNKNILAKDITGYGLKATIKKETYYAGSSKLVEKLKLDNPYKEDEQTLLEEGATIVYIMTDKKILGLLGIRDNPRKEAKKLISNLKKLGLEVIMISGDNQASCEIIAQDVGIKHYYFEVLPKDKAGLIKDMQAKGKNVIMVGDGINDAPALTSADIGIALNGGREIAANCADVILLTDNLAKITSLLNISKSTLTNIKENLFWAFLYNIFMIPLAMGLFKNLGISINPMLACLCMILSSLTVIFNALRLKKVSV